MNGTAPFLTIELIIWRCEILNDPEKNAKVPLRRTTSGNLGQGRHSILEGRGSLRRFPHGIAGRNPPGAMASSKSQYQRLSGLPKS